MLDARVRGHDGMRKERPALFLDAAPPLASGAGFAGITALVERNFPALDTGLNRVFVDHRIYLY